MRGGVWYDGVGLRKSTQPTVIPARIVVIQPNARFFSLPSIAEIGGGVTPGVAGFAVGAVTQFAHQNAVSVDGDGRAAEVVAEQIVQLALLAHGDALATGVAVFGRGMEVDAAEDHVTVGVGGRWIAGCGGVVTGVDVAGDVGVAVVVHGNAHAGVDLRATDGGAEAPIKKCSQAEERYRFHHRLLPAVLRLFLTDVANWVLPSPWERE